MSWPEMPGCLLRLRYAQVSADSADLDELPDWSPHAGQTGALKPSMGGLVVYDPQGARIVFDLDVVLVEVDADGWLCKRPADGGDLIPLRVAPTDDPLMSVTGWRWTLTLGQRTIGPFPAPSSGVVELADFVTAPATDATKAWVERIPELIELLTGAGVDPEAIAAAVADYLAANPVEGVTVADVLAEIAAHEGEADPHPQYLTGDALSDVVREGDVRLTDAREPTAHGHVVDEVSGLATVATSGAYADLTGTPTIPDSPDDIGAAPATQPINAQTTAYTLTASDAGKLVTVTAAAGVTLTVPASTFTAGQRVDIADRGTARVTVVAGSGMTVNPPAGGSLVMEGRYAYASLVFLSATEADLVGLVAAA